MQFCFLGEKKQLFQRTNEEEELYIKSTKEFCQKEITINLTGSVPC